MRVCLDLCISEMCDGNARQEQIEYRMFHDGEIGLFSS